MSPARTGNRPALSIQANSPIISPNESLLTQRCPAAALQPSATSSATGRASTPPAPCPTSLPVAPTRAPSASPPAAARRTPARPTAPLPPSPSCAASTRARPPPSARLRAAASFPGASAARSPASRSVSAARLPRPPGRLRLRLAQPARPPTPLGRRRRQGRANKDEDTCYSFWAGAALRLLGAAALVRWADAAAFSHRCQAVTPPLPPRHPPPPP